RGKGTYVSQACSVCRDRKIKCDGAKPVCTPCGLHGRHDECTWGRESARKPRTEAHFQALRRRIQVLEAMVEQCRQEHGPLSGLPSDSGASLPNPIPVSPTESYLSALVNDDDESDAESVAASTGGYIDITQELCLPTRNLKLEDRDLLFHGVTAPFSYEPGSPSVPPQPVPDPHSSYILLVDGVNESAVNLEFDWARHLPPEVPLLRKEHDRLLDIMLKFYTSWCLRIIPKYFLRDMAHALSTPRHLPAPKTPHYSPMLHNALITVASAFSDDPMVRDFQSREYFAKKAKSYIDTECRTPNLSVIQALNIIGSYHSSRGEQTLGFIYFGMSGRMSQTLGLGVNCSDWVKSGIISPQDMQDRYWGYWTTFGQDVCWSLYVGRDFCLTPPKQDLAIPFGDADFDHELWYHPPSGIPPQPCYLGRTFVASIELLQITRNVLEVIKGLSRATTKQETPNNVVSSIEQPDKNTDHVKLCRHASENIMELASAWRNMYTLRYVPVTFIQVVFAAGTVFLLLAVHSATGIRVAEVLLTQSLNNFDQCIKMLVDAGQSWPCALNISDILENLLHSHLIPFLARR
ncbi:hypothetical protein FISHEDRAFT_26732, partial [Fistulina hepatica ATCC 64428]